MVVEDEPEIYDVLLAMFELWGVEGVSFVDGTEALAWIDDVDHGQVRRELPELALLDIRLHEVTGTQIAARLRRSPFLGQIPIVLITAFHLSPEQEYRTIAEAQADLLMYKPLPSMPDLRRKLDLLIEGRKATAKSPEQVAGPAAQPVRSTVRRLSSSHRSSTVLPAIKPDQSLKTPKTSHDEGG